MLNTDEITNLLSAAVPEILAKGQFKDRSKVIGASEVGMCARLVVHRKLNETPVDPDAAGRMLRGTALENVCVQIVREAFPKGSVAFTGANQRELRHESIALVCHPDGEVTITGEKYALEIKTADPNAFRSYVKKGLKVWYEDQCTVEAGLGDTPAGTLLILVDSSNLSNNKTFYVPFNAARFLEMEIRAVQMLAHLEAGTLPDGEPTRTWSCSKCSIKGDCPAFTTRISAPNPDGPDPLLVADLTEMLDEIKALEDQIEGPEVELKAAKEALKSTLASNGLTEFKAGAFRVTLSTTEKNTFDSKAFMKVDPTTYQKYLKPSSVVTMRFNWGD